MFGPERTSTAVRNDDLVVTFSLQRRTGQRCLHPRSTDGSISGGMALGLHGELSVADGLAESVAVTLEFELSFGIDRNVLCLTPEVTVFEGCEGQRVQRVTRDVVLAREVGGGETGVFCEDVDFCERSLGERSLIQVRKEVGLVELVFSGGYRYGGGDEGEESEEEELLHGTCIILGP